MHCSELKRTLIELNQNTEQISLLDAQITMSKDNIESQKKALVQMDAAVNNLVTNEKTTERAISVRNSQRKERANIANTIIQSLHGYNGQFGGSSGFYIAKADVVWQYNTYDDTVKLNHIIMDCTLDIPT